MSSVFDKISGMISREHDGVSNAFYLYEPWDIDERPQYIVDKALEDGIDLNDKELIANVGQIPRQFQSGYLLSTKKNRYVLGGSQVGKSYAPKIEVLIMATGEIPFSLRYPKGHDTKIKREINKSNIIRFGRFDSKTGKFIDNDYTAKLPESWSEWDCGTVKGVGIYPQEKIAPPGSQIWIGTFAEAKKVYWWPSLGDIATMITPLKFVDQSRGNNGINKQDDTIYFIRDNRLIFLTYEMGHRRFEAQMAWSYVADEETPTKDIFQSAQQHAKYRSMLFSPINGITWTKKIIFTGGDNKDSILFHATQYDSPYQDKEDIEIRRKTMEPWYRASRIWGIPTEVKGCPYFDRKKLYAWRTTFKIPYYLERFAPSREYYGIRSDETRFKLPGLMDVDIRTESVDEDNRKDCWRIYEHPKPNVPYILSADPAEGDPDPDAAGDVCAATIMRPSLSKDEPPVIVATIRSTLETIPFARTCLFAAKKYNNAMFAAETKRGFCNAAFFSEAREWPFWYKHAIVQDSTSRVKQNIGFDTNTATRDSIFELIKDHIDKYEIDEYPYIPDENLIIELEQAVVSFTGSGKKRCDHTNEGTLDSSVCFGILLYIFKNAQDQIRCNLYSSIEPDEAPKRSFWAEPKSEKKSCNLRFLGFREV
jgi:hypothetical protein